MKDMKEKHMQVNLEKRKSLHTEEETSTVSLTFLIKFLHLMQHISKAQKI